MKLSAFKVSIEAAFADVPYPGDDNITSCGYKETFGEPCAECVDIADYFQGKTWREHKVKDLRVHVASLNLFTDEALYYYLPAFVLADLADPEEADVISEHLIYIFAPAADPRAEENARRLSPAQRRVMLEYFHHRLKESGDHIPAELPQAIDTLRRVGESVASRGA